MLVTGLDHIYLAVSDFDVSERFYDRVMRVLGFRKGDKSIAGEPHAHYFVPTLHLTIRPARGDARHDPYAPGLHHVCLQLATPADVDEAVSALRAAGVDVGEPKLHPEYAPDYYATSFCDPDGIRLELVCRTRHREDLARHWSEFTAFLNPLAELRSRRK